MSHTPEASPSICTQHLAAAMARCPQLGEPNTAANHAARWSKAMIPKYVYRYMRNGGSVLVREDFASEFDEANTRESYDSDIRLIKDGDQWMAHDKDFEDLVVSDACFAPTPKEAAAGLKWIHRLRREEFERDAYQQAIDGYEKNGITCGSATHEAKKCRDYANEKIAKLASERPTCVPETVFAIAKAPK